MSHLPIYKKLISVYTNDILTYTLAPGKQIDSINKIMIKHSVSRETAKIVLNHLAKEGLIVKIPGKGSFVKEPKSTLNRWGFILPMYSSNMEQLIDKISTLATDYGMKLEYYLHYNNPDEEIRLVSTLIQQGYDTLFIVPNYNEALTAKFYSRLNINTCRLFLMDYTMAGSSFNYVIQSYDLGVKRAVEYLAKQNNSNLLFVNDSAWYGINLVAESMLSTFVHYGELVYNRKVISVNHHNRVTKDFIINNSIGGILCYKDTDTIKLYGKLIRMGFKFPKDITIVNYGNTELIELFEPGLTAIDCLYNEMVDKVRLMYNKNIKKKEQYIVSPKLVVRNT